MSIDKRIDYEIQGGVKNFRPSEMVTVPKIAKSSPNTPTAKLAYITPEEEKILVDLNLYGSLKGKPNRGPGGIPSLEGDFGPGGKDFGGFRGGADIQSAERGDFRGFDGSPPVELPPGVRPQGSQEAQNLRSAFIAAGGGQRVNPGFFDSRNVVSPFEIARAKAFNPRAFRKGRNQGIGSFFGSGGFFGNILRGIGQRLGFGKRFNEPTYDMRRFSDIGLYADRVTPAYYDDFDNKGLLTLTGDITTADDDQTEIEKQYGEYLMDAPPNPLTLEQFKNALEGIKEGTLPNTATDLSTRVPNIADLIIPVGDTGSALTTPVEGLFGLNLLDTRTLQQGGFTNSQIKEAVDKGYAEELAASVRGQPEV
tara:strand:- start:23 stop:1120 length:1098 start_codon:yes stop_codon:yes gene_type:complete